MWSYVSLICVLALMPSCLAQQQISDDEDETYTCPNLNVTVPSTSLFGKFYTWGQARIRPINNLYPNCEFFKFQSGEVAEDILAYSKVNHQTAHILGTDNENFFVLYFCLDLLSPKVFTEIYTVSKTPSADVVNAIKKVHIENGIDLSFIRKCVWKCVTRTNVRECQNIEAKPDDLVW